MKKFGYICLAVLAIGTAGCWEKSASKGDGPLWQSHFVGIDTVQRSPDATTFQKVWKMPETGELREQALQKLARAPFEFWKSKLPQGTKDENALIRPLLDDLLRAESFFEVRGPADKPEAALAIKLAPERAGVWDRTLAGLGAAWKLGSPAPLPGKNKGWELIGSKAAERIQFLQAGEWIMISFGPAKLQISPRWLETLSKTGQPSSATAGKLLELNADLPGLRAWLPLLQDYPLPPVKVTVQAAGANLKTEVLLKYSSRIPFNFEPWNLPTELIKDPLVSFTVAQGLQPLLNNFKGIQSLGLENFPNQICIWGQDHKFPVTFLTAPIPNAVGTVNTLAQTIPKLVEQQRPGYMGEFLWNSNKAVIWKDVPFIAPRLAVYTNKTSHYIFGELFPRGPFSNSPPAELFSQFKDRKDVIYYDWELTHQRMPHADQLFQLHDILSRRRNLSAKSASQKWITAVSTNLADCITEIKLASATELQLTRKSQLGFTGFELVTLARWINSAHFPLEFEASPQMPRSTNSAAKAQGTTPGSLRLQQAPTPKKP